MLPENCQPHIKRSMFKEFTRNLVCNAIGLGWLEGGAEP